MAALHAVNDYGLPPSLMPIIGLVAGFLVAQAPAAARADTALGLITRVDLLNHLRRVADR